MQPRSFKAFSLYIFGLSKQFVLELFEPKVSFYAASMSWSTLFFVIPLLVITLSIIIYTPLFSQFYDKIHTFMAQALVPTSSKQVMEFIDKFVANANSMGIIGAVYVVVAAALFFRDFDYIINDIFGDNRRGFFKALLTYGSLTVALPLTVASSIWLLSILNTTFHITPAILQFLMTWFIILIIYKVAPKEEIPIGTAAMSSFIAAVVWHIAKTLFLFYILYNKTYTTIYGAISIIMFTFLWIYISWTIFLHGMQLCKMLLDEED